ncbi:MAG: DUF3800 domain-containing protein [Sedimentisphaerales bacterium]
MYVDECGNPDLKSSDNPIHRFLSLTGVIIDLDYVNSTLYRQIESLKSKYFGSHPDDPIILHRKEIVNAKHPFEVLRDKKIRKQFDTELLYFLKTWEYTVVSVCLDKQSHKETYQVWRYEPYHYCLALLLERYAIFLEQRQAQGDVMAESRGGKKDRKLKDSFSRLWKSGTEYVTPERFQIVLTSKQLKVKPKANNISDLQIADIIAHPSRTEILIENDKRDTQLAPFAKKIVAILEGKYYQHEGSIFGKKFI